MTNWEGGQKIKNLVGQVGVWVGGCVCFGLESMFLYKFFESFLHFEFISGR